MTGNNWRTIYAFRG